MSNTISPGHEIKASKIPGFSLPKIQSTLHVIRNVPKFLIVGRLAESKTFGKFDTSVNAYMI